jgi:four helix bundle protein
MARIERFEDIEAWKSARHANKLVFQLTRDAPFSSDRPLVDQMRRASVSVLANIAEGFERGGNKEFIQFLSIAKGSCGELRAQLYAALDQGYIDEQTFQTVSEKLIETSRLIAGFIRYLRESQMRGNRFKPRTLNPEP